MWQSLHDAWWRLATQHRQQTFSDTLAASLLQLGSVGYRAGVQIRNAAYDQGWLKSAKLPCGVVSVGNLTVGGTGKTACVSLIAKTLRSRGRQVAVLSRGYGGGRDAYWLRWESGRLLVNGQAAGQTDALADEPQVLAKQLAGIPVIVGAGREHSGRLACRKFKADALILDDGFQHRRLARDLDLVLVNASMPPAGLALLPRGPMREPMSALARAQVIMVTKADEKLPTLGALRECLQMLAPQAVVVTTVHQPCALTDAPTGVPGDLAELDGRRVGLVSSIGDPDGFESTVRRLHAHILWHQRFPDHHRFSAADWAAIERRSREAPCELVVTTEKDWMRLRALHAAHPPPVAWQLLEIRMRFLDGEAELDARLAGLRAR